MGGRSSSRSSQAVTTNQTDRRIGATDDATVITEGGSLTENTSVEISSVDDRVVTAALDGAFGFAEGQTELLENAILGQAEGVAGLNSVLRSSTIIAGLGLVAAVLIFRGRS